MSGATYRIVPIVLLLAPALASAAGGPAIPSRAVRFGAQVGAPAVAETDTALDNYLEFLADSTDRYFGPSAARPDTAGHDSLLAHRLSHPFERRRRLLEVGFTPRFAFNRVDGPVWGGEASLGRATGIGRLAGEIGYAAGPNVWLGGGAYRLQVRRREATWTLQTGVRRRTESIDRDSPVRSWTTLRALVSGRDHKHYLRRDGLETALTGEAHSWRAEVRYRDMFESPLATTTTWNLAGREPVVRDNLAAATGRVHEIEYAAGWRLPWVPVTGEVTHHTSSGAIGSDFEYRRTRVALAADLGVGRIAALVPQIAYGRLSGEAHPQASFFLGGPHSLRSLPSASRGGTGMALVRLDWVGLDDVLGWVRIPHPAAFPIQVGLFVASGAVWGPDPYGGPSVPGTTWPRRESWLSESGVSLLYQPGIPDPTGLLRLSFAWPLGPRREPSRWTISYTRALDLVTPLGW